MVTKRIIPFFLLGLVVLSEPLLSGPPPFCYEEQDGSPAGCFKKLKFPNGNVTDNGDGSFSIADNTSVGGGNSVYLEEGDVAKLNNSSADLTLDFNGTDFDTSVAGAELDLTIAAGVTRDTEWDTEAEVQTAWGSVDILLKTEGDSYYQPLEATLTDIADGTIVEDLVNTANPWADNEVADSVTAGNVEGTDLGTLTDGKACTYDLAGTEIDCATDYQPLESTLTDIADGTITENLVNTANPWADNEVADTITASNYLALAGGTLTGEVVLDETGIEGQPTDALTDCSTFAATGGGIFYDDSEGQWKKCEDNVLSDLDTGGGITGTDTHVTFFDGANSPAGDAGFTYNKTTDSATLAGDMTVATEVYDATGWNGDNTVPTKDAVRDKIETISAGSGSTAKDLPIFSAKITGTFVTDGDATQGAQIDAGDGNWRLLFDATTDEGAVWQFVMPDNYTGSPALKIKYSMASATANEVEFEGAIMCVTPGDSADVGTASFSTIAVAADTVPGTAGYPDGVTITLTDDASPGACAAGDQVWIYLSTDADDATNDDATGDREVIGLEFDYA